MSWLIKLTSSLKVTMVKPNALRVCQTKFKNKVLIENAKQNVSKYELSARWNSIPIQPKC